MMSVSVCKVCEAMLSEYREYHMQRNQGMIPRHRQHTHHASATDFLMAVAWGCPICSAVEEERQQTKTPLRYFNPSGGDVFLVYIFVDSNESRFPTITIGIPLGPGTDTSAFGVSFNGTPIMKDRVMDQSGLLNLEAESTGDRRVFDRAAWWLSSCLESHPVCQQGHDPKYYPPRLMRLTTDTVTIIDTSKIELVGPYATLSYCWGRDPKHLTLTSRNYNTLSKGFQASQLSKTFKDAIKVALHFGIRLLWIDSLCILQSPGEGHRDDWQRHVREMKSIYSNCRINIAADFGENADDGCFSVRNIRSIMPCVMDIPQADPDTTPKISQNPEVPAVPEMTKNVSILPQFPETTLSMSHLLSRGWVHQERLLSPRVLHFGKNQLHWECSSCTACETFPRGIPSETISRWLPFSILGQDRVKWRSIVMNISRASFSYSKDKFAAISGVAQRVAQELQEEYVAGFFRGELLSTLPWHFSESNPALLRITEPYRAPTWSWASVNGPIRIPMFPERDSEDGHFSLAQVDDITLDLVDRHNPYGLLKGGSLTITAPTAQISPLPESRSTTDFETGISVTICNMATELDFDFISIYFDESILHQGRENAVCVPLSMYPGKANGRLSEVGWMHGLVLTPADRFEQPSAWARIGSFSLRYNWSETQSIIQNCTKATFLII